MKAEAFQNEINPLYCVCCFRKELKMTLRNNMFGASIKRGLARIIVPALIISCIISSILVGPVYMATDNVGVKLTLEASEIIDGKATLTYNISFPGYSDENGSNFGTNFFELDLPEGCEVDLDATSWDSEPFDGEAYLLIQDDKESGGDSYFLPEKYFQIKLNEGFGRNLKIPLKGVTDGVSVSVCEADTGDSFLTKKLVSSYYFTDDSNLSLTLGSSSSGDTLTDSSFSGPSTDYFTNAGIIVTPSADDLTFTVTCDEACVVARDNGDGTYSRMTGTLEGNVYKFEAASANDQFVIAVKGDLNGDGDTGGTDASQIDRFEAGLRDLTALQVLACDITGDGEVNGTDAAQIKRVEAGLRTLAWG
jgi:hypothetical protein